MEKNEFLTLIFCTFYDNRQKFVKEGDMSKKKSWGHPPFKTVKSWRSCRFGQKCYICLQINFSVRARWMSWSHCDMNLRAQKG